MKWFLKCLKNYATFNGRARRKEYWMFTLMLSVIVIFLSIISSLMLVLLSGSSVASGIASSENFFLYYILIVEVLSLAFIIPSLAVTVRRLHDINKSGWWFFISYIPVVGPLWMLVLLCTEGDRYENNYGQDPKIIEDELNGMDR